MISNTAAKAKLIHVIQKIREKHKVNNYLAAKGYFPTRQFNGKSFYLCPLPKHKDSNPSFVVYSAGEYETFYCFGCKARRDIIDLHSFMTGKSRRDAIRDLSGDIALDSLNDVDYIVQELKKEDNSDNESEENSNLLGELALKIGSMGFSYMTMINKDPTEVQFLETIYKKVDAMMASNDVAGLVTLYSYLVGDNAFSENAFMYRYCQKQENNVGK